MAVKSKILSRRYEFKYIVDERTAERVRDYTNLYLPPDQFTLGKGGLGYPVHSLYLDSADLLTCRAVQCGEKNRFKLRIRFYTEFPTDPVYFEIKRRDNLVIMKERAAVHRSSLPPLLAGDWPRRQDLIEDTDKNFEALFNFCRLRDKIGARPTAYTSYMREGYEPPEDNVVRVTFDRNLRAGEFRRELSLAGWEFWPRPEVGGVVLELKFTDRFPAWMHHLVQTFNLNRGSMPKYVKCVTLINGVPAKPFRRVVAASRCATL